MGKYRSGRRVAVQGGRALMERVENLVRGGAIPKPVWFDAMKDCPPPTLPFRCVRQNIFGWAVVVFAPWKVETTSFNLAFYIATT